eukprot:126040_1
MAPSGPGGNNQPNLPKAASFSPGQMNRNVQANSMMASGRNLNNQLQTGRPLHFNKTASTGNIMGGQSQQRLIQPNPQHFNKTASTGNLNVGGIHKRDKTKIYGADPNVPAPPTGPGGVAKPRTNNAMNQQQGRGPMNAQQMTPQQKAAMMRQQQIAMASQRNLQQQRQVQRRGPAGGWGPQNPWFRYYQQQRMMAAAGHGRGRGGAAGAQRHPYYQQWAAYYQRMSQNPQGQLQQMVMQQQQMIGNLKRQLQDRDKHYHQTIQTTINFKDMEINE